MPLDDNELMQLKNLLLTCSIDNFNLIKNILKGKRVSQKSFFERLKLPLFGINNFNSFEEAYKEGVGIFFPKNHIFEHIQVIDFAYSLYLYEVTISDFNFLPYWEKLERISIDSSEINDISGLKNCPNLRTFSMGKTDIQDISPLKNLQKLSSLSLNELAKDVDMSPIKEFFSLTYLDISGCNLSDLDFINSPQLVVLYLNNVNLTDLNSLPLLDELYLLNLNKNHLSSLKGLENSANIELLYAENNLLTDINIISELPKLKQANLSDNKIERVNFATKNYSIIELNLSNNPLKSLNSIENLTALSKLLLINCPVENWEILTQLPNLQQVYISKEKGDYLQNLLPNCQIIYNLV